MTTVQMIPPASGARNSISVNGRTYTSAPGAAIAVPDFDAAILQANGWLLLSQATTDGQVQQSLITSIETGLAYKGASPSSFSVRAGALGIWSMIRTGNYASPCINLRRSSDNVTQDIGFRGDVVDYAAADAFVGAGNTGFITRQYDQSGSGHDLTQAVAANQPVFLRISQWNGIRPFTEPNVGNSIFQPGFLENAAVRFNANSCTIITVVRPRESYTTCNYYRAAVNSSAADSIELITAQSDLLSTSPGLGIVHTGRIPVAGIKVAAGSYGATTIIDSDGVQTVFGATTSLALGYISFGNSLLVSPTQYNFHGDYFFQALYPITFTANQLHTIRATLSNAFVPPAAPIYNLVYGGNSLVPGFGGTNAQSLPYVAGIGRATIDDGVLTYKALPDWECHQLGSGGRTMLAEYTASATWLKQAFDATKAKNVCIMCDVSNDIFLSGGYASTAAALSAMITLYGSTFTSYLAAIKAARYSAVIVPTVISRGDAPFQLATGNFMEDARLFWNALIRIKAAANGFIVSDRAASPPFSLTTGYLDAVNYAADKVHPRDAGNIILAGIDRAAILSA